MRRLDELRLEHPVYESRKLTVLLGQEGLAVNRKARGAAATFDGNRGDLCQAWG